MKLGVSAGVASTLLVSLTPALGSPPEQPEVVTICQLNAHPRVHDGKSVRLSARILTDAIEHTDAADANSKDLCAVSIHYGLNPASVQHVSSLREALIKAYHISTEAHELLVVAQLVGVFHQRKAGDFISILEVTDATSIEITEGAPLVPPPPRQPK